MLALIASSSLKIYEPNQFYGNKPTIVLFTFLPIEAAFHKISTLLLITFDPIA